MTPAAVTGDHLHPARPGRVLGLVLRLWANPWIWSAAVQGLGSGMSLLVSVVAARLLGVAEFGTFVLVQAGVVVLSSLQYQLVSGPMAVAAGHRSRSPAYFGAVARITLSTAVVIGVAAALYCLALVEALDRVGSALPIAAAIFGGGYVIQDGAKRIAFATVRPRTAFACECVRHVLLACALAAMWFARGVDAPGLLVCAGLSGIAAGLPICVGALRARSRAGLNRAVWRHHWLLGRWLVLMILVSAAYEQLPTILVGAWLSEDAAAGLRAAQILVAPLLVLIASLENIVPRRAAQSLRAGGEASLVRYLLRILVALGVPVVAACAVIAAYGATLLGLLLGHDFRAFAGVAAIIALGPPLILAREFGIIYLRATRRTGGIFAAFAASAVVTLLASYPLIAVLGVRGAAVVFILGHAVSTVVILGMFAAAARRATRPVSI